MCQEAGITIDIFLVPSWSQSEDDIRFAYRLAESTRGRVFFTAGRDLDRYVVWVYVKRTREIVASRILQAPVDYYQAYLPEGKYDLYFFADLDRNGYFDAHEMIGQTSGEPIEISKTGVKDGLTINGPSFTLDLNGPAATELPMKVKVREQAFVYPALDDEFFDPKYGVMGIYDPKAMMTHIQRFFFSLEKFDPDKTIVIFVHGIGGTPRDSKYLVDGLDKTRYQPWFYFYPSGMPLQKLGSHLAQIIELSNKTQRYRSNRAIVVAHSMGGLVALLDNAVTAEMVDRMKNVGFQAATQSGISIAMNDLRVPDEKEGLLTDADKQIDDINEQFEMGLITGDERYDQAVSIWRDTTDKVQQVIQNRLVLTIVVRHCPTSTVQMVLVAIGGRAHPRDSTGGGGGIVKGRMPLMKRLPVIPHCVILVAMAAWFARLPTTDKCPPFTLGWEGKYTAQLFEHLGFEVAGEWYVVYTPTDRVTCSWNHSFQ